jgi:hypothetical protein
MAYNNITRIIPNTNIISITKGRRFLSSFSKRHKINSISNHILESEERQINSMTEVGNCEKKIAKIFTLLTTKTISVLLF